jgi:hypothetical protein
MDTPSKFEHGNISPNVSVEHATIRVMSDSDEPNQEMRLQGRIKNICQHTLDEVKCDLSYFGPTGVFLGLDTTSFCELDEIDPGETAPFNIQLTMPIEATRCVFNVHSKRILQDIAVALQGYVSKSKSEPGETSSPRP